MKKHLSILLAALMCLCLAACGNTGEDTNSHVSLTDVAADAVPADEIAPADVSEVAVASEEMILVQPMEQPTGPAFGEPSSEAVEETTAPAEEE